MLGLAVSIERSKRVYRLAVGSLFFLLGLCSASWASRIPSIQQQLHISDSLLGIILFALPVGSMISLSFAGQLVTKYGSKKVAGYSLLFYSILLYTVGLSENITVLITALILFGMAGNTANIAVNTQAVGVEARYGRNIMASFHGLWSLAGFSAAAIGTVMIGRNILPQNHFIIITAILLAGVAACFQYLLPEEEKSIPQKGFFVKPDKALIRLGIIAFCCMICEGAMFDWSGIYFQNVVEAKKEWIGAGYTAFMLTMATGRFVADWLTTRVGFKKTIQASGALIATGLGIAVIFPFVVTATIGFLIVGFGVSSVIPLIYSEAGKSKTTSPGVALTAVSSIGFLGFLIGPPFIGVIAGAVSLRISFVLIACIGILITIITYYSKEPEKATLSGK
jgi:MFS family permease